MHLPPTDRVGYSRKSCASTSPDRNRGRRTETERAETQIFLLLIRHWGEGMQGIIVLSLSF